MTKKAQAERRPGSQLWRVCGDFKLLDKIRSVGMGGISADDDLAVEKLTKNAGGAGVPADHHEGGQCVFSETQNRWTAAQSLRRSRQKSSKQIWRSHGTWTKASHTPPICFPNNNANIRRVRQRIEELSSRSEFAGWTFPRGEAKINEAENRCSLFSRKSPMPISGRN